jgi:hypothetical protein
MVLEKGAGPVTDSAVNEARNNVLADRQSSKPSPDDTQELVIRELRHLSLRLKLIASEVDLTGFQLRIGVIDVETAIERVSNLDDPVGLFDREAA